LKTGSENSLRVILSTSLKVTTGTGCFCKESINRMIADVNRWDEKAGLRRDAIRSQVIDALEAQEIKETGNEED
jgi:hypothetical protein